MDKFFTFVEGLNNKPNQVAARQAVINAAHIPTYLKGAGTRTLTQSLGLTAVGVGVLMVGVLNMSFGKNKLK